MYEIVFYRNRKGREPVLEYLKKLTSRIDKDSRLNANKICKTP